MFILSLLCLTAKLRAQLIKLEVRVCKRTFQETIHAGPHTNGSAVSWWGLTLNLGARVSVVMTSFEDEDEEWLNFFAAMIKAEPEFFWEANALAVLAPSKYNFASVLGVCCT